MEEQTAQDILNALYDQRVKLRAMGVQRIGLFGSRRRGTATSESDIDFLVQLARPSFDDYMNVKIFLEDTFGSKVDLVLEDSLKPRLRPYILAEVAYAERA